MPVFVARRIALAIVVVLGVIVVTFVVVHVVPGDPAATWAGPHASASQIAGARKYLGLDRPLAVQLVSYLGGIASGNWSISIHTHRSVLSDLMTVAPASLELVITALVLAMVAGIPIGLFSARRPGRPADQLIRAGSIVGISMPIFWMALILQLVFSQRLKLLPAAGEFSPGLLFTHPLVKRTGFPVIDSLLGGNLPMLGRMVRAQVLDTIGDTHILNARALGFGERQIFSRFAMKLAWTPVAAAIALVFGYSLVNTFLVESIFDWPGLGSYAAASIATLDTPAILGVTLFVAVAYVGANLVVDVVQAAIAPRIRLR